MNECIVCGSLNFNLLYGKTLKRCVGCGFTTANMEISPDILKKTYSINYFKGEEYLDYQKDKNILQLNFAKRLKHIKKATNEGIHINNSFEIGCAYGFFGETLIKNIQTNYKGIDIVPEAIKYGRDELGLDLVEGDYLNHDRPTKPYSDVFMWDVIEHLQYPEKYLKKAHDEMIPGGRLYITTGDIGSYLSRMQGKKWRMIHPPSHLHYFSKSSLSKLLKKNGFNTMSIKYLPVYRSIRQVFYSLFLLNKKNIFLERIMSFIPSRWTFSINTFDIIFIIAEKDSNAATSKKN